MKPRTLLLLVLLLVLILGMAATLWRERDRHALTLVNRALAEYDLRVDRVQGFDLAAGRLHIRELQGRLPGAAQASILIGLDVRYRVAPLHVDSIHIDSLHVSLPTQQSTEDSSRSIKALHAQWRDLPIGEVRLDRLRLDDSAIATLRWRRQTDSDRLQVSVDGIEVTASLSYTGQSTALSASAADNGKPLLSMTGSARWQADAHPLSVALTADTAALWSRVRQWAALQHLIEAYAVDTSGKLDLALSTAIADSGQALAEPVQVVVQPVEAIDIRWRNPPAAALSIVAAGEVPVDIRLQWPDAISLSWSEALQTAAIPILNIRVSAADAATAVIGLSDIECAAMTECRGRALLDLNAARVASEALRTGPAALRCGGAAEYRADRVVFRAGADCRIALSAITMEPLTIPQLSLQVSDLVAKTVVGDGAPKPEISARYTSDAVQPVLPDQWLPVMTLRGKADLAQDRLQVLGDVDTVAGRPLLRYDIAHSLEQASGGGRVQLRAEAFSPKRSLAKMFRGWPYPADIIAGSAQGVVDFQWRSVADAMQWQGRGDIRLQEVAGKFEDIGAVGVQLTGDFVIDTEGVRSKAPLTLEVGTVDVGLPLTDLVMVATIDTAGGSHTLHSFDSRLLSGSVSASDFVYRNGTAQEPLNLLLEKIQLERVLALTGFEAVAGSGLIDGVLPLQWDGSTATMTDGWLAGRGPGVIRYATSKGARTIAATNPSLQLLGEALSNYHYETLRADATLNQAGDLKLAVTMRGQNPDMRGGQRINLNLNVENNIPELMRTLRAGRIVDDVLARHMNKSR